MQPSKIRVLLCDDHALVREGTRKILEAEPDIEVVGEAQDGFSAVEMVRKMSPDVVAMDVSMPRMNGIEATRRIKALKPETRVLVLTAYDDFQYVLHLLQSGASGYILKSSRSEELVAAIRATYLGDSVMDADVAQQVFARLAKREEPQAVPKETPLTEGELRVLQLAAEGLANKEIADALNVSPRTVQSHMSSIFLKLGVSSRTEAVVFALKTKMIGSGSA